ncbi:MAG: sulfate adenylyltransferase [Deltaproteobacteria bacterium]|nr:sulfate adenylyltransferase [Deltaproteobacteria bacterium]
MSITPHGDGNLVDLRCPENERAERRARAKDLPSVKLDARELTDLELLAIGGFSPLEGFMTEEQCKSVVNDMHLPGGVPWTVPVTLGAQSDELSGVSEGDEIALVSEAGEIVATQRVESLYSVDKANEARQVYRTDDGAHPGVEALQAAADRRVGGPVSVIELPAGEFPDYRLEPSQTRAAFADRGWNTIVAFQTRNPIHRAHEYITKVALEIVDGLLIHPLVGETKAGDIPADVRMACYTALIDGYYNPERVMLSVLPASMRYAGPREAVFHAIMRRNYGCTHFIVGRDHAGVGDYYGTYDAQLIFDEFDPAALGITPVKLEHSFWCKRQGGMATSKTTNSKPEERVFLSGTKVREMLEAGEMPPVEFTRPEVAKILVEASKK